MLLIILKTTMNLLYLISETHVPGEKKKKLTWKPIILDMIYKKYLSIHKCICLGPLIQNIKAKTDKTHL